MSDITTLKYNLIKAEKAKELVNKEYFEYVYIQYMKKLNEAIIEVAKLKGGYNLLFELPPLVARGKIIEEIKDAGYTVEYNDLLEEHYLEISWS